MPVFTAVDGYPGGRIDEGKLIRRCPDDWTVFIVKFMESDRQATAEGSKDVWQCSCCEMAWPRIFAQWVPEKIMDRLINSTDGLPTRISDTIVYIWRETNTIRARKVRASAHILSKVMCGHRDMACCVS